MLAHGKLYEHGFAKKRDGHKLCAKSRFDRFFTHHLGISKYRPFATSNVLALGKSYEHDFPKNATVIIFAQTRAQS
ncbi:hypothetical protein BHM03_00014433 [Ensete ventricosum]|nr:hypothetical protein BHM03_00014433 [Ensete ventricosum]